MNHPREKFASAVAWGKKILDPQNRNKILLLSCLIAVSLDPLFFYVLVIEVGEKCLSVDSTMEITASVLRSVMGIFYMLYIIFQFRTGRGVLVDDTWAIAKGYLPRDLSVSSNNSSPSETEKMEEANHAAEDQGNNDHAITISGGEDQGNEDQS